MKKLYFLLLALCFFNLSYAQIINITNPVIKKKLLDANEYQSIAMDINGRNIKIDTNNNGEIEVEEALKVYILSFDFYFTITTDLSDFNGMDQFTSLKFIGFDNVKATAINFNKLVNLEEVNFYRSYLGTLDVSGLKKLTRLRCGKNSIGKIDLNGCTALSNLDVNSCNLTDLDVSSCKNLEILSCSDNLLTTLNVAGLLKLKEVGCFQNKMSYFDFGNASNLEKLNCDNNELKSLDVSSLKNLKELNCGNNQLISVNIKDLKNLDTFRCGVNKLTSLDVRSLTNLSLFFCNSNELSSLFIDNLQNLSVFNCDDNKLTSLNLTNLVKLDNFSCNRNEIASLDFTNLNSIYSDLYLSCSENKFSTLDLSSLKRISKLYCPNNPLLETINIKNGSKYPYNDTGLDFSNNPNLNYICQDDSDINLVQSLIQQYGYKNCTVNSYCSFEPGGDFFTIDTKNKFDLNNNGCDDLDLVFPNLYLKVSNEVNFDNYVYNTLGSCIIPVPEGKYNITPVLENPDYFNVSPLSAQIDFPTQTSPFKQNFCVTSKGSHPDLEISILPLIAAVPGFDSKFKIVIKNKGNLNQSGTVNFNFDDAILEYVSSNIISSTHFANTISWDFSNLNPFESRENTIVLRLNKPTDTPAINNGDILKLKGTISSNANDESPLDNTFNLNQTVVGSYDPNDKTCLEGEVITPDLIGEYVHYMIRFENTGTYQAQNIVVKDMIDLDKFDISTLIPTSSSHSFVTKISEQNKVEFIFENINLPFDDANNDGYIAFKIKTKPTLVVGDSFANDANIYFDYNFPILTNKATSTFKSLGTEDFEFSRYFTLYPNPSTGVLNITQNQNLEVKSFEIFDILGQLVIAVPNAKTTSNIDVSKLKSGNYFIKVKSDKGSSSIKFIKL